jgi:predicted kinase
VVTGDLPLLVLISGPPGAGKSTLAVSLSGHLDLPLLSIDRVKSGVAWTMTGGIPNEQVERLGGLAGQTAFLATYDLVNVCLNHGVSLIVEKAWYRGRSETELREFLPISRAVQVHVTASQPVAVGRFMGRPSWWGAAATARMAEVKHRLDTGTLEWEDFAPLDLGIPLHVVATDDGQPMDLGLIEDFIMKALAGTDRTG